MHHLSVGHRRADLLKTLANSSSQAFCHRRRLYGRRSLLPTLRSTIFFFSTSSAFFSVAGSSRRGSERISSRFRTVARALSSSAYAFVTAYASSFSPSSVALTASSVAFSPPFFAILISTVQRLVPMQLFLVHALPRSSHPHYKVFREAPSICLNSRRIGYNTARDNSFSSSPLVIASILPSNRRPLLYPPIIHAFQQSRYSTTPSSMQYRTYCPVSEVNLLGGGMLTTTRGVV